MTEPRDLFKSIELASLYNAAPTDQLEKSTKTDDHEGGRWVTLGGKKDGEEEGEEHHGHGVHVYIENGRITKGPKDLVDKDKKKSHGEVYDKVKNRLKDRQDKELSDHWEKKNEMDREEGGIHAMRTSKKKTAALTDLMKRRDDWADHHRDMLKRHKDEHEAFENSDIAKKARQEQRDRVKQKKKEAQDERDKGVHDEILSKHGGYNKVLSGLHREMRKQHEVLNNPKASETDKGSAETRMAMLQTAHADLTRVGQKHGVTDLPQMPDFDKELADKKKKAAPKKKAEKTQYHRFTKSNGYEPVEGKKVDVHPDLHAFTHKNESGEHIVSHAGSGLVLGRGTTGPKALANAKEGVERAGAKLVNDVAEKHMNTHGSAPGFGNEQQEAKRKEIEGQKQAEAEAKKQAEKHDSHVPDPNAPDDLDNLDPHSKRAHAELHRIEGSIVRNPKESGHIVTPDGRNVWNQQGEKSHVDVSDAANKGHLKGNILTHNHPGGSGFSLPDIGVLMHHGLKEIRAIGKHHLYRMQAPHGKTFNDDDLARLQDLYNRHDARVKDQMWDKINKGQITPDEAQKNHHHEIWKRIAPMLGLKYSKEDNPHG